MSVHLIYDFVWQKGEGWVGVYFLHQSNKNCTFYLTCLIQPIIEFKCSIYLYKKTTVLNVEQSGWQCKMIQDMFNVILCLLGTSYK